MFPSKVPDPNVLVSALLYEHFIAYKDDARFTAMAVNPFNLIKVVEDLKSAVSS